LVAECAGAGVAGPAAAGALADWAWTGLAAEKSKMAAPTALNWDVVTKFPLLIDGALILEWALRRKPE
jgi:hypothetical protein